MSFTFFAYNRDAQDRGTYAQLLRHYPDTRDRVSQYDYWFFLYTDAEVVAECGVSRRGTVIPCWTRRDYHLRITDVWVHEAFRGQDLCRLLLLNVLYYFDQLLTEDHEIRIHAHRHNRAAIRAYRKVFGPPEMGPRPKALLRFSTHPRA